MKNLLLILLLMGMSRLWAQEPEVAFRILNPSFEEPDPSSYLLSDPLHWIPMCTFGLNNNSPDWRGPVWEGVAAPAQDGDYCLGMVVRPFGYSDLELVRSAEGISGRVDRSLSLEHREKDVFFILYLASLPDYMDGFDYVDGPAKLQVHRYTDEYWWASPCGTAEAYWESAVWESPLIDHSDWRPYVVSMKYGSNMVRFLSAHRNDTAIHGGNILIDNISPVYFGRMPQFDLGPDQIKCAGDSVILDISEDGLEGAEYRWSDGSTGPIRSFTQTGTYWVEVEKYNIVQTDTVFLEFVDPPKPDLGPDTTLCLGDTLWQRLSLPDERHQIRWQDSSSSLTYPITQPGYYQVEMYATLPTEVCYSQAEVLVSFRSCTALVEMPNVFTPNFDGVNDLFKPISFEALNSYQLRVYDRWGRFVWETDNPWQGWNGLMDSGRLVESGTYFWHCRYSNRRGEMFQDKGTVVLLR